MLFTNGSACTAYPAVLSRWERLAAAACEVIWDEEDSIAAEEAAELAAEEAARLTRLEEEKAVAEGKKKATGKGQLVSLGGFAPPRTPGCGAMPGAGSRAPLGAAHGHRPPGRCAQLEGNGFSS